MYTHSESPEGKVTDPQHIRVQISMEKPKLHNETATKNKISTEYLSKLIDTRELKDTRKRVLVKMLEEGVDNRTLVKLKNILHDKYPNSRDLREEEWRVESSQVLHKFSSDLQDLLL